VNAEEAEHAFTRSLSQLTDDIFGKAISGLEAADAAETGCELRSADDLDADFSRIIQETSAVAAVHPLPLITLGSDTSEKLPPVCGARAPSKSACASFPADMPAYSSQILLDQENKSALEKAMAEEKDEVGATVHRDTISRKINRVQTKLNVVNRLHGNVYDFDW